MPKYRNPKPTVDILIELAESPDALVSVERKNQPFGFALPGGFVDVNEFVADAAIREANEEVGLRVELVELFHVYSDPRRDPRQHMISIAYIARAAGVPMHGDDASHCFVAPADSPPMPLAFDHATIVADYVEYRRTGRRPPPRR
jgi:8-oxo-dGTP diphosphatase